MEGLRKIADIARNHYEKIILILVLVGLGLAVWYVYDASQEEKLNIEKSVVEVMQRKPEPVPPADTTNAEVVLKLAQNPRSLSFGSPHNVLNPVKWRQNANTKQLTKITDEDDVTWGKMAITRISPLPFTITLDRIPNAGGYILGLTRLAAERPVDRRKKTLFVTVNVTNKFLDRLIILRAVKGPPDNPQELVLEFADSNEPFSITPEKPFERIEGYEADLRHEPFNLTLNNLRVGTPLKILDEEYVVVAITENEVVVSARANEKLYTVRARSNPPAGSPTGAAGQATPPAPDPSKVPAPGAAPPAGAGAPNKVP